MLRWKIAQAAEIRWWKNYLKNKNPKEYLTWKKNYWTDFLQKCNIQLIENQRILDAGCGPAGIFTILNNQEVVAIDPLCNEYQLNFKSFFEEQNYPNVVFQTQQLENIQTEQKSFDYVFCLNVINHVVDMKTCLQKLWQLTKPGGTLIVSVDAHNYLFFKHLFRLIPADILHPHQYDLVEYKDILKNITGKEVESQLFKEEFFFNYFVLKVVKSK